MQCTVRAISGDFEIRWFKENLFGVLEDLGLGSHEFVLEHNLTSRYHYIAMYNHFYNPSFLGKYWCQVINTTADPDQPLMRSNVFTLLAPEDYVSNTNYCSVFQYMDNVSCADLPVQPGRSMPHTPSVSVHSESVTESPQSTVKQG